MTKNKAKLFLIYGINGSGKFDIASYLADFFLKKGETSIITRESRIIMYLLGIVDDFDARVSVALNKYKILENTNSLIIKKVYQTLYEDFIFRLTKKYNNVFLLSHLVFALYIDKERVEYLSEFREPVWLIKRADLVVNVNTSPRIILKNRADTSQYSRSQIMLNLGNIKYHQELCNKKWLDLKKSFKHKSFYVVNHDTCSEMKDIVTDLRLT
jgi:thymidylate kinase